MKLIYSQYQERNIKTIQYLLKLQEMLLIYLSERFPAGYQEFSPHVSCRCLATFWIRAWSATQLLGWQQGGCRTQALHTCWLWFEILPMVRSATAFSRKKPLQL